MASLIAGRYYLDKPRGREQTEYVKSIEVHHEYKMQNGIHHNDLAVIITKKPFQLNNYVKLAKLGSVDKTKFIGSFVVAGWGRAGGNSTVSNELLKVSLGKSTCSNYYTPEHIGWVCAGDAMRGSFKGESGGPLHTRDAGRYVVVGLVSFGSNNCDTTTVFMDFANYRTWINAAIAIGSGCLPSSVLGKEKIGVQVTSIPGVCPLIKKTRSVSPGWPQHHNRTARHTHDFFRQTTCENLIREIHANFVMMDIERGEQIGHGFTNPIISAHWKWSDDEAAHNRFNVQVPVMVHAVLDTTHRCNRDFVGDFTVGAHWENQMVMMGRRRADEKGHLVAVQICGPPRWYNLAPQTPALNRNVGRRMDWSRRENRFARWLDNNCGHIELTVILNYDHQNPRPKGFKMCYEFRNGNNELVDGEEVYFDNEV